MDRVEPHNLDRLVNAGRWDVGRYKVHVAAEHLERSAAKPFVKLAALPVSLRQSTAYRAPCGLRRHSGVCRQANCPRFD